jgi:hypothetical protein
VWRVLRRALPWQARFALAWLSARLPDRASRWLRRSLLSGGPTDSYEYVRSVFEQHYLSYRRFASHTLLIPRTVIEIGPGDSLALALCWCYAGAERYLAFDVEDWARRTSWARCVSTVDRFARERVVETLSSEFGGGLALRPSVLEACDPSDTFHEPWSRVGVQYVFDHGIGSHDLESGTVDFAFAHAVFQHIPLGDLPPMLTALRTGLGRHGVLSIRVNLKDHRATAWNANWMSFLTFEDAAWERIASAMAYTNRLRHSEWLRLLRDHGFEVVDDDVDVWEGRLPLEASALAPRFRQLDERDLRITGCHLVLRPAP